MTYDGPIIDADIHQSWEDVNEVLQYLPARYQHRAEGRHSDRLPNVPENVYQNPSGNINREDITDDGDGWTDPADVKRHHLDEHDIDYALLNGQAVGLTTLPNPDYATELAEAVNKWVAEKWLPADDRFVASIHVPQQAPERAAEVIRNWGSHPQFVSVMMNSASHVLYGKEYFWPIYSAAEDMDLPISLHIGLDGQGITGPTASGGHTSTYFEHHNILPTTYLEQINSMICEGVFVEFPNLEVVSIEGGIAWVPHLMWRMDKNYSTCRRQVPWLEQRPSTYLREHVRFTQQPLAEPDDPSHLAAILEMMHAEETLLFSTDFPHWDGDYWARSSRWGLPQLDDDVLDNIMFGNAAETYGLAV